MLMVDYKLLSGTLAARLLPHMTSFIHYDQSGFIPQRCKAHNIRRLMTVLEGTGETAQGAMILSIDMERAFDSLRWDYLYATMAQMGLG